jgi:hypothetical protein
MKRTDTTMKRTMQKAAWGAVVARALLLLSVLLVPATSWAQKIHITIVPTVSKDDTVGKRFVYELREQLAKSALFKSIDGPGADYWLRVVALSDRPLGGAEGTTMSTVLTRWEQPNCGEEVFVTNWVHNVTSGRVQEGVNTTLATVYDAIGEERAALARRRTDR